MISVARCCDSGHRVGTGSLFFGKSLHITHHFQDFNFKTTMSVCAVFQIVTNISQWIPPAFPV